MKLQRKLLITQLLPIVALAIIAFIVASVEINDAILDQAFSGMEATSIAVREMYRKF